MKLTAQHFNNLDKNCPTIKAMVKWAGKREFTIQELQNAFKTIHDIPTQALDWLKPQYVEQYYNEVVPVLTKRVFEAIRNSKRRMEHIESSFGNIQDIPAFIAEKREIEHKLEKIQEKKGGSAAVQIMTQFYQSAKRETIALNPLLKDMLENLIKGQVDFKENDITDIYKNCLGGYWFNANTNGNGQGEWIYRLACIFNTSVAISFEKFEKLTPYLLNNRRLFAGTTFQYGKLYCRVTGWNKANEITCVTFHDQQEKGKRGNVKFDRESWLVERKKCKLITDYSFNNYKY